jgi:hypothetical protein
MLSSCNHRGASIDDVQAIAYNCMNDPVGRRMQIGRYITGYGPLLLFRKRSPCARKANVREFDRLKPQYKKILIFKRTENSLQRGTSNTQG